MQNKYLEFISDEHLLSCIKSLYESYNKVIVREVLTIINISRSLSEPNVFLILN